MGKDEDTRHEGYPTGRGTLSRREAAASTGHGWSETKGSNGALQTKRGRGGNVWEFWIKVVEAARAVQLSWPAPQDYFISSACLGGEEGARSDPDSVYRADGLEWERGRRLPCDLVFFPSWFGAFGGRWSLRRGGSIAVL